MRKKQRIIAGAGLTAGLIAGGGAGLIIGAASGSAGAAGSATAAVTDPTTPTTDETPGTSGTGTAEPAADREQRIRDLLQPLVDDGTITTAQLDAIVAKLATAETGRGFGDPGKNGHPGWRHGLAIDLDTVATALGMTPEEVRAAQRDGTTLKALAESKGKTAQDVIDALVAATKARLDQAVTDGKLTQAEADTRLAEATTRITDAVNNGAPAGLPHAPGAGHRHWGEPGDGSTTDATPSSTPDSTPSTTTG